MTEKDTSTHHWLAERRYFPLIIASVFIILSISAFFICYRHHVVTTEQVLHEDRSAANLLSLLLNEHLNKVVSVMESYSSRPLLIRAAMDKNAEKAKAHLISLTKNNPDIDSVIITDRQGTLWAVYPEHPEVLGKNFAYRDWYQGVSKEWRPYISDVYQRVVAEKDLAVAIGVPVINEKGKAIGILQNTYRTVSITNIIKQLPLDPGARITVADRKGQLIYSTRYNAEKEIRFHPFHADMKKAAAANHKTFAVVDHEFGGKTRYISFAPVGNIGWTVSVGRYKRSIVMSEFAYYLQVTAIVLLLFLSVVVFLFYTRKQVTVQLIQEQLEAEKKKLEGEKKLRSLSLRHEAILSSVTEIIMEVDNNKVYTWANSSGYEFFGEDVIGKEASFYFEGEQDIYDTVKPLFCGAEDVIYLESWQRRKDGEKRLLAWWCRVLKDENGQITGALSSVHDITDRKRAEEALKKSEDKFRNLFDNALEGVYQTTPDGRLITANMALARMFDYASPEEMINTITDLAFQIYANQDDRKIAVGIFREMGFIKDFECRMRRKDGSIFWASYDGRLTKTPDGIPCFEGFIMDITDRKKAEEELARSEQFLASVIEQNPTSTWISDGKGTLVKMNRACRELFGVTEAEVVGKYSILADNLVEAQGHMPLVRVVFQEGTIARFTLDYDARDVTHIDVKAGRRRILDVVVSPIRDAQGKVTNAIVQHRDVTELRRAEHDLKASETRYRGLFESARDGILILDADTGMIVDVNPFMLDMLGYSYDTFIEKHLWDIGVFKDIAASQVSFQELQTKDYIHYEHLPLQTRAGCRIDVEFVSHAYRVDNQKVIQCNIRDITERKRAEAALRESEKKYRNIFENATEGIFQSTPKGRYINVNPAFARIGGYSSPEEMMESVSDIQKKMYVHQEDRARLLQLLNKHDSVTNFEAEIRRRDNAIVWISMNVRAIRDEGGEITLLEGTITDITQHKQAEQALRKNEDKFRNLFDNALEGVYQSTPEGRLITANMAFARMFGYESPEEMINTITDLASQIYANPDDRKIAVGIYREKGYIEDFECRARRKDGSIFWVRYDGRLTETSDGTACLQGFIIDITERKRAQDELRRLNIELEQRVIDRTAKLEAANKELEAFSYSVSHDLRSPLRAIDGFSNILMKEYTDRLDAEGVRLLNVIRTNTKNMDQLITDMLSLSRVSKSEMKLSLIDMTTLAHSIYQEITSPEVRRKFGFSVAPLPDSDGDPVLLRHVWSNLLANAVKFTLPREERRIEISGYKEQGMNIYAVRDTGVGFNPNYAHKLFGVFQRLHKSSEFEGNGVGLAIVRRIVERHGGRVWAEGKINEGATFFFSLPIKEVKDEPQGQ